MKRVRALIFISIVAYITSCNDTESTNCIVKEAILRNGERTFGKEVYIHDGSNYIESRFYVFDPVDNKYLDEPGNVRTFEYDDKGRIVRSRLSDSNGQSYKQDQYLYMNGRVTTVHAHFVEVVSGQVITDTTYSFQFVENPKDTIYKVYGYDEEYKNGNLVRRESAEFRQIFKYDNHPNITNDFPFLHWIYAPNFGYCRNNNLEEINDKGANYTRRYSFAYFGDGKLNRWTNEDTGRNMSFVYECQ